LPYFPPFSFFSATNYLTFTAMTSYSKKKLPVRAVFFFYLGFITNPKKGRVKALSKACLDRTY